MSFAEDRAGVLEVVAAKRAARIVAVHTNPPTRRHPKACTCETPTCRERREATE